MGATKLMPPPDEVLKHFEDYRRLVKETPYMQHDFVGASAKEIERKKERPLILVGFFAYMFEKGICKNTIDYYYNKEGRYNEYVEVMTYIGMVIANDQVSGGMAMIYSQPLTARLNNLIDKTETTIKEQPLFPDDAKPMD
jgi:hypothetical protein